MLKLVIDQTSHNRDGSNELKQKILRDRLEEINRQRLIKSTEKLKNTQEDVMFERSLPLEKRKDKEQMDRREKLLQNF